MPRRPTREAAEILTDRLLNRGYEGSREWISAWVRRWGAVVARDTETNPLFKHGMVSKPARWPDKNFDPRNPNVPHVKLGIDEIPIDLYREWKDIQDGSRKVVGVPGEQPIWKD